MAQQAAARIDALDLIRGIAVLGILVINIAGFAGPSVATLSPHLPSPGTVADEMAFAIKFLIFEGKMRALFSLLFGASLVLFIERCEAAGKFGEVLQLRRLGWLGLFGLAHFYLFWWGDILFLYAVAGVIALFMHRGEPRRLAFAAIAIFAIWHLIGAAMSYPQVALEERVRIGTASAVEAKDYAEYVALIDNNANSEVADLKGGFIDQARSRIAGQTLQPLWAAFTTLGETLPLMLLGVVLFRTGFFGNWARRRLWLTGLAGTGLGLALTLGLLGWLWPRDFPPMAMEAAYLYWGAIPHLLMGTGYAALLVLAAPRLAGLAAGRWLASAGQMAFSNYLATTLLMTAIFYGWGLGWIGRFGHAWQWAFILLGWLAMVLFSTAWLGRFRRGPLEWAWRSLVEKQLLPNR